MASNLSTSSRVRSITRRGFLTGTLATAIGRAVIAADDPPAAGAATGRIPVSGQTSKELSPYDELMLEFMRKYKPPGAALAVCYQGRLVYARGFGYADVSARQPVLPNSLFRIASLSKSLTSAAIFHLVDADKLNLDDRVLSILKLKPHVPPGKKIDPRLHEITIRQCLQHTAGWDRDKSFDPMSSDAAEMVSKELHVPLPIRPEQIIEFMAGRPLEFDPGTAYAYSNFGYCLLGRVIETVSGLKYHDFVSRKLLAPLGIERMRLGRNLLADRAADEVKYYDSANRMGRAVCGPQIGRQVPLPYGVESVETMDANGGWIASTVDMLRFAASLDHPQKCPILGPAVIASMLAPPPGKLGHKPDGSAKQRYYGCGWQVRPSSRLPGRVTKWHTGLISGTSTLLVCRDDGIGWAVFFNSDATHDGKYLAGLIDPLLHGPADAIKHWPDVDLFAKK